MRHTASQGVPRPLRRRWLAPSALAGGLCLPALALLSTGAGPASATPTTATSVLAAAKGAIAKQTAVHLVVSSRSGPTAAMEKVIADLGRKSGEEVISIGSDSVTIKVTSRAGYIGGNPSGLAKIVGLTAAQVKKVGRDWITVLAGSSQYTSLASDITVSSVTSLLPGAKGTTLSTSAANTYVLHWTTAATSSAPKLSSTLTIAADGTSLPIEETTTATGSKETLVLSKWGERVNITAPPAATTIPFTKVSG